MSSVSCNITVCGLPWESKGRWEIWKDEREDTRNVGEKNEGEIVGTKEWKDEEREEDESMCKIQGDGFLIKFDWQKYTS